MDNGRERANEVEAMQTARMVSAIRRSERWNITAIMLGVALGSIGCTNDGQHPTRPTPITTERPTNSANRGPTAIGARPTQILQLGRTRVFVYGVIRQ